MKLEIISTGKTVEEAIENGRRALGVEDEQTDFEILERPKKTFLGLRHIPAKVRVFVEQTKADIARDYLDGVLKKMGLDVELESKESDEGIVLSLKGEGLGVVIGRRGETLDALQYLSSLVANREGGAYQRVSIDIGDYRRKREETLEALARKLAAQAVRTGRSVTLEPMNPYERRVIHSAVQEVEGATSRSIGEEPNRRVIISSTAAPKKPYGGKRGGGKKRGGRRYDNRTDKPAAEAQSQSAEVSEATGAAETRERPAPRDGERREYRRNDRRDGGRGGRGRGPKPEQPVSTRPAEVKEEAKDKPLYGKIEL